MVVEPVARRYDRIRHPGITRRAAVYTQVMRTSYLAFGRPNFSDEEEQALVRVLRSGWVGMGPETLAFERELADFVGAPHVVTVNSCTSALFLSLLAAGVRQGDEVICPSLTWCSTANAALYLGVSGNEQRVRAELSGSERGIAPQCRDGVILYAAPSAPVIRQPERGEGQQRRQRACRPGAPRGICEQKGSAEARMHGHAVGHAERQLRISPYGQREHHESRQRHHPGAEPQRWWHDRWSCAGARAWNEG